MFPAHAGRIMYHLLTGSQDKLGTIHIKKKCEGWGEKREGSLASVGRPKSELLQSHPGIKFRFLYLRFSDHQRSRKESYLVLQETRKRWIVSASLPTNEKQPQQPLGVAAERTPKETGGKK